MPSRETDLSRFDVSGQRIESNFVSESCRALGKSKHSGGAGTFRPDRSLDAELPRHLVGHAHHLRWFADPETYRNARAAVLSNVDQTGNLLRGYLLPDLPPKDKAADDFGQALQKLAESQGSTDPLLG
jgi:hypothetical protein